MVEARQKVDQFDANIPSDGVIVYQVQTSDPHGTAQNGKAPIELLTITALKPGQAFISSTGAKVQVKSALPGGFSVGITSPADSRCAGILQEIADIDEELKQKELLPDQHIVDTGYVDAQLLHQSHQTTAYCLCVHLGGFEPIDLGWHGSDWMGQIERLTRLGSVSAQRTPVAKGHVSHLVQC